MGQWRDRVASVAGGGLHFIRLADEVVTTRVEPGGALRSVIDGFAYLDAHGARPSVAAVFDDVNRPGVVRWLYTRMADSSNSFVQSVSAPNSPGSLTFNADGSSARATIVRGITRSPTMPSEVVGVADGYGAVALDPFASSIEPRVVFPARANVRFLTIAALHGSRFVWTGAPDAPAPTVGTGVYYSPDSLGEAPSGPVVCNAHCMHNEYSYAAPDPTSRDRAIAVCAHTPTHRRVVRFTLTDPTDCTVVLESQVEGRDIARFGFSL
jgi:hypothetical protein